MYKGSKAKAEFLILYHGGQIPEKTNLKLECFMLLIKLCYYIQGLRGFISWSNRPRNLYTLHGRNMWRKILFTSQCTGKQESKKQKPETRHHRGPTSLFSILQQSLHCCFQNFMQWLIFIVRFTGLIFISMCMQDTVSRRFI